MIAETLTSEPQATTNREEGSGSQPRIDLLENTEWDSTVKRLILHANWRCSRYGNASSIYQSRAEEYAQEAIALFLEGTRHYDGSGGTEFFNFLSGCVDSLVSHDVEKAKRRKESKPGVERDDDEAIDFLEQRTQSTHDFEKDILDRDELDRLIDSFDPDLQPYLRLRAEIDMTAAQYAQALNVSESTIRNMDKRIRRGGKKCKH